MGNLLDDGNLSIRKNCGAVSTQRCNEAGGLDPPLVFFVEAGRLKMRRIYFTSLYLYSVLLYLAVYGVTGYSQALSHLADISAMKNQQSHDFFLFPFLLHFFPFPPLR